MVPNIPREYSTEFEYFDLQKRNFFAGFHSGLLYTQLNYIIAGLKKAWCIKKYTSTYIATIEIIPCLNHCKIQLTFKIKNPKKNFCTNLYFKTSAGIYFYFKSTFTLCTIFLTIKLRKDSLNVFIFQTNSYGILQAGEKIHIYST